MQNDLTRRAERDRFPLNTTDSAATMAGKVVEVTEKTSLLTKVAHDEESGTFPVASTPSSSKENKWTPWAFIGASLIVIGLITVGIIGITGGFSNGDDDDDGDGGDSDDGDGGEDSFTQQKECKNHPSTRTCTVENSQTNFFLCHNLYASVGYLPLISVQDTLFSPKADLILNMPMFCAANLKYTPNCSHVPTHLSGYLSNRCSCLESVEVILRTHRMITK